MTGLPTLLVELDDPAGSGTWPYDITAYVDMRAGWSLTGGRQDELGEVDPAQARLTLNNRDGRFTVGSPTYGIVVDQRVRIVETFGVTTSTRITGHVQDWPVMFSDAGARNVPCSITVVDRQARLARRKLTGALAQEQRLDTPSWLYTLGEAAGATTAGDTSGNYAASLALAGTGAAVVFGAETGIEQTGVTFAAGRYLTRGGNPQVRTYEVAVVVPVGYAGTAPVLVAGSASFGLSVEIVVDGADGVQAAVRTVVGADPLLTSPVSIADGLPHLLAVRAGGGQASLVVDGVQVASDNISGALTDFDYLRIGQGVSGLTVFGAAGYPAPLSAGRLEMHYRRLAVAGVSESSDARVARLASYGNIDPGDLALETGVETALARQTVVGASLLDAIDDVVVTEGGSRFIRGDDKLVMQNRQHRVRTATGAPAVELTSEDIEHGDLQITTDKQYLQNEVTGTRVDGATQTARNDASIGMYEQYPSDLQGLLVTTDAKVRDRIAWQVEAYGQPKSRLNRVTINLLTLPDAAKVGALLSLVYGDRLTIDDLPSPQSPIDTADLLVEGLEERQGVNEWNLTLNTVSADLFRAWILGDATYGVLSSTTRPHY